MSYNSLLCCLLSMVIAVCSGCARTRILASEHELNMSFLGILVFEETPSGITVHFPDGSGMNHTAFVRFRQADLPHTGNLCTVTNDAWVEIKPTQTIVISHIADTKVNHALGFFWKLFNLGVLKSTGICDRNLRLREGVPHAKLELTGGYLEIDGRTKDEWQFRPGPSGEAGTKGSTRKLVNLIGLKASFSGSLTIEWRPSGKKLVFAPNSEPLRITVANTRNPCPRRVNPNETVSPGPDKHFALYYTLLEHDCAGGDHTGDHIPHGRLFTAVETIPSDDEGRDVEGGGCPPLIIRR